MPKSVTTAAPPESRTLSGLMSRWTMPRLVRVAQRARHVAQHADHFGNRQRSLRQSMAQRFALHVRHGEVRQAVGVAGGEHRDDVGLAGATRRAGSRARTARPRALRQVRRQHLDHHLAVEPRLLGHEDARHPAAAEFALDGVLARQRARSLGGEAAPPPSASAPPGPAALGPPKPPAPLPCSAETKRRLVRRERRRPS